MDQWTMLEIEGNVIIERMKCSLFTDIHIILSKNDLKLLTKRHCKLKRRNKCLNYENEAKGK